MCNFQQEVNKSCYQINTNCSNFIFVKLGFSSSESTLLVDSGAELSIFKVDKINQHHSINSQEKCTITGINSLPVETLGSTETTIYLPNNLKINHTFQLVDSSFPIPTDGILGRDFFTKFHCSINYDTWFLTIVYNGETIEVPIEDNLDGDFILPPRCEVFRQVYTENIEDNYVLLSQEITPGVYCANSIVNSKNHYIKFINTNNTPTRINKNFKRKYVSLRSFDVYNFNKIKKLNRNEKLINELNLEQTPETHKEKLINLCTKFNDVFALQGDKLSSNNFYKQKINLSDNTPVYIKNYRSPEIHRQEIITQVDKLLTDNIIQPSVSPYNSPILLVPKKSTTDTKKWRLVVDFRQLNKRIVADKFPLPRIDDILDQLGRAKYFTTLDLMSGFHQVELEEDSKQYTAFSTPSGHFEFNRLPFGLNISPNSFQRMMTIALSGLPPNIAFLYIDDIIVVGCSINHHIANLEKVFQNLRKHNLKLNPSKCIFFCADVTYLGHHISEQGIQPDKSKYSSILNYPEPKSSDDVRRFVAFCNYYRRFIPYFADIAAPLNALLRKNAKFVWSEDCKCAFKKLRNKLLSPQILKFPDFNKTFILSTDASKVACGAVLSQKHGDIDLPIAYASRSFTKGESNKSTIEQELTAIHWAIMYFRPYLYGRKFLVKTDHRPLVYLFSMTNPSSKLTRMRVDLEEFNFDVEYVKGKENVGPDALSRISIDSEELKNLPVLPIQTRSMTRSGQQISNRTQTANEIDHLMAYDSINNIDAYKLPKLIFSTKQNDSYATIYTKNVKKVIAQAQFPYALNQTNIKRYLNTINDMATESRIQQIAIARTDMIFSLIDAQHFKKICNEVLTNVQFIIYQPAQIIKDENKILRIIEENHVTPLGGHVGINKLTQKLRRNYYWINMKSTITKYVKSCLFCKQNKHTIKTQELFTHTTTPDQTFQIISMDTIGPLTRSNKGNRYALTIQCELSKYVIVTPIVDKQANTLAKAFVESLILKFGCPSIIKTDMGTEYRNEVFQHICKLLQINHNFSTAYHPETIGSLERNHRCLNEYLRHFINEQHDDWDSWLPYYTFCYNTTPHSEHTYSPFELVFGRQFQFSNNLTERIDPLYNTESYFAEMKYRLQTACSKAKMLLDKSKTRRINKTQYSNPIQITTEDVVWLRIENRRKLDPAYSGPFKVINVEHPNVTIENTISKERQTVHKNRLIKN